MGTTSTKYYYCNTEHGGGFSHWHGLRICACLLGHLFAKFGIAIGGFHQRRRSPNYINWVYFGQIIVKSTQFDPNWVLFFRKWYTDGWEIWQKIGIEIVRFSRSGRHIHVRFWWKNPPPPRQSIMYFYMIHNRRRHQISQFSFVGIKYECLRWVIKIQSHKCTEKPEWIIWLIWAIVGQYTDKMTQKCVKNESFCPCSDTLWLKWVKWFTRGFQC